MAGFFDGQPSFLAGRTRSQVLGFSVRHKFDAPLLGAAVFAGEGAGGIGGTAKKGAVFAKAHDEASLAALRAHHPGVHPGFDGGHALPGSLEGGVEVLGKAGEDLLEGGLSLGDAVEVGFEGSGKSRVHETAKVLHEEVADGTAQLRGDKGLIFQDDVVAIHQGADDGGIGGGPANAEFFEFAHEGGLGKTCRRLGEFLFFMDAGHGDDLAGLQFGKECLLAVLRPNGEKAREDEAFTFGSPLGRTSGEDGRCVPKPGRGHLRGHEALPDEAVEFELLCRQVGLYQFWGKAHVHRSDGLVGVLGTALRFVAARRLWEEGLAEGLGNEVSGSLLGLSGNADRVSAHVGDEGLGAAFAKFDAFVEALGNRHGALGREPEAGTGFLLEGRGDERRFGVTGALFFLDGSDLRGQAVDALPQGRCCLGIGDLGLVAVYAPEFGHHRWVGGEMEREVPVLLGDEGLAFAFSVNDEAQGHRLNPPCRQPPLDFGPQEGRDFIAHQSIEDAAGLLGVKERSAQIRGVRQGLAYGPRRDFVEPDALEIGIGVADQFRHVPGNGLAFSIRIWGEIHNTRLLGSSAQFLHDLRLPRDDLVVGYESVLFVHPKVFLRQVAHMPHGGLHPVSWSQELGDGFDFGR